jgi:hypothetical protein
MGQFCLTGVHYHFLASLKTPEKYEETVGLFSWLDSEFPRMHWFKGDQLADFWDELGAITDISQESYQWGEKLEWAGSTTLDQTILIWLATDEVQVTECYVDGISISFEQRRQRVFVVLPDLDDGNHSLMAMLSREREADGESNEYQVVLNSMNKLTIFNIPKDAISLDIEIYDIMGRRIKYLSNTNSLLPDKQIHISLPELANGTYIVSIQREGLYINRRITVVR